MTTHEPAMLTTVVAPSIAKLRVHYVGGGILEVTLTEVPFSSRARRRFRIPERLSSRVNHNLDGGCGWDQHRAEEQEVRRGGARLTMVPARTSPGNNSRKPQGGNDVATLIDPRQPRRRPAATPRGNTGSVWPWPGSAEVEGRQGNYQGIVGGFGDSAEFLMELPDASPVTE